MLEQNIFNIDSPATFNRCALEIFEYQYQQVSIYQRFCNALKRNPSNVSTITEIPFLPVEFFRTHPVLDSSVKAEMIFSSSGTTNTVPSKHYVADLSLYERSFLSTFERFISKPSEITIMALLPSYFEQEHSSLIYMVDKLIKKSGKAESKFYLDDKEQLVKTINTLESAGRPGLLIGVSYALLDLIEAHSFNLDHIAIMETGGMKGRRKEIIREELHRHLKSGFGVEHIYSEYGMTELLSQAYSPGEGIFNCPPWMKVLTRDTEDALSYVQNTTGGVNIIDLANKHSCSFIATQDLGRVYGDGSFEILGRFDNSDIRGCNLMVL